MGKTEEKDLDKELESCRRQKEQWQEKDLDRNHLCLTLMNFLANLEARNGRGLWQGHVEGEHFGAGLVGSVGKRLHCHIATFREFH